MLTQASDQRLIKGVYVEETGYFYTHGQFSNDTHVIVEASKPYIKAML